MAVMGFLREHNTKKLVELTELIVPKNFSHSYVVGATGCGKTSSFIYQNLDNRIQYGHGILLLDHKGKEHTSSKFFADKHNRLEYVTELGVPWGASCNLIKNFNEKDLRSFVISIMSMKGESDYWGTSGANLVISIWKTIKAYRDIIKEADEINNKKSYEGTVVRFKLPTALTFAEIANICKSTVSIASFLNKVQKLSERFEKTINSKIEEWLNRHDEAVVKNKYLDLMTSVLHFKYIVENEMKSLEIFKEGVEDNAGSRSSTYQTLVMAMSIPFASVAENKVFNDPDGLDLAHELDQGKIIVINSQEISNVVLGSLVSSTLQELSKRVRQTEISPVSIFIDESQRVLSKEIDLHTDVLREAKVELFLAFQNYSLMNNVLGESNFKALILNLVSSYHFKNGVVVDDLETNTLKEFECFINGEDTVHTAKPIFLNPDEIFEVELEYFKLNNIYEMLNIDEKYSDQVIQFNPILYQKNQIDLKAKDGTLTTIKLRDKKKEEIALKSINELIVNHKVTLVQKKKVQQHNMRKTQPTLSDLIGDRLSEVNEFMGEE